MPAFRPNPTDSTVRLATWLFFRFVGAIVLAMVVFVTLSNALFFISSRFFVAQVLAFLVALWCSTVLLFEALDVFLDAKLESVGGGAEGGGGPKSDGRPKSDG